MYKKILFLILLSGSSFNFGVDTENLLFRIHSVSTTINSRFTTNNHSTIKARVVRLNENDKPTPKKFEFAPNIKINAKDPNSITFTLKCNDDNAEITHTKHFPTGILMVGLLDLDNTTVTLGDDSSEIILRISHRYDLD